jgi:uncharacterized membrane protein
MNTKNTFFMLCIFILGLYLMVQTASIDKKLKQCDNQDIINANKGLLVISVIFVVFPISYFIFNRSNDDILDNNLLYKVFMLLLGIVLTGLGSVIHKNSSNSNCEHIKSDIVPIIVLGVLTIVASISLLSYDLMNKNKKNKVKFNF